MENKVGNTEMKNLIGWLKENEYEYETVVESELKYNHSTAIFKKMVSANRSIRMTVEFCNEFNPITSFTKKEELEFDFYASNQYILRLLNGK